MEHQQPFFFGGDNRSYGVYHAPNESHINTQRHIDGVVVCPPPLHEGLLTETLLRQVSDRLAKAGLHVLRFDFSGCGNSMKSLRDCSLDTWVDDVATAHAQLLLRCGDDARIAVLSVRFATQLVCEARTPFVFHCAWDPLPSGQRWYEDLVVVRDMLDRKLGGNTLFQPCEYGGLDLGEKLLHELKTHAGCVDVTPDSTLVGSEGDPQIDATILRTSSEYTWLSENPSILFLNDVIEQLSTSILSAAGQRPHLKVDSERER